MKKILSIKLVVIVLVVLGIMIFLTACENEYIPTKPKTLPTSGELGDCTWKLEGTKLIISGKGEIPSHYIDIDDGMFVGLEEEEDVDEVDYYSVWAEQVTDIVIEDGVTKIGDYAFSDFEGLTSVTIGDDVTYIGEGAFEYCRKLTNVKFGKGLTEISDRAFEHCQALKEIILPKSVNSIGFGAFYQTGYYNDSANWEANALYLGNHLIVTNENITGDYKIKNGTKTISPYLFRNCQNIQGVTIPESVTKIGEESFLYCYNLENIIVDENNPNYSSQDGVLFNKEKTQLICCPAGNTASAYIIPNGVNTICEKAFIENENIISVTIPKSVTTVGGDVFNETNINDVYYSGSAEECEKVGLHQVLFRVEWHYNQNCNHVYNNHICKKCGNYDSNKPLLHKANDGKYYYYEYGVKNNETKLAKINGKRHYIKNGVWNPNATGVYKILSGETKRWYYIEDGVTRMIMKLYEKNGETLFINMGRWYPTQNDIYEDDGKYYSIKSGRWCKDKMILECGDTKYYCKDGFVQVSFTGEVRIDGVLYTVVNGRVLY